MTRPLVAEIVTFRLKKSTPPLDFTKAAEAMTPFLRSTQAMVSRTLSVDSTGLWHDHILWTSEAAAKEAASAMFARAEAKPFMDMIDTTDVDMRHARVTLHLSPD